MGQECESTFSIDNAGAALALASLPASRKLLIGCEDGAVRVVDTESGQLVDMEKVTLEVF